MKGINKYLGAMLMGAALVAVPSCTDTWDEHYRTEDENTASETLWELLTAREELSKFCEIAASATYYRDEKHPAYTLNGNDTVFYTFKDVLNGTTPLTVWAPVNDALTADEWAKYAAMAKTEGYNLQQQFIGSHMALYRKSMSKSGTEKFRLINSKFATLDYDQHLFENSEVTENDIPARNGILHILKQSNEFFYNLYEYIKFSGETPRFSDYIIKRDTTYFWEAGSIEGMPDANGNPTYVDSAYIQDNLMFNYSYYNPTGSDANDAWMNSMKMFAAMINAEDSSYVMVVPTDIAWQEATEKMQPYYNYGDGEYPRMDKVKTSGSKGEKRSVKQPSRPAFPNGKGYQTVDSLQAVNIDMDIIQPLAFNINLQPQKDGKPWTKKSFIEERGYAQCEYLLNTVGDTIRNVYDENGNLIWDKNTLFETGEIKEMSNGYAIKADTWAYSRDTWMRDIDIDVSYMSLYDRSTNARANTYNINNEDSIINVYGKCCEQGFMNISGSTSTANPVVAYRLDGNRNYSASIANVMSAKYDVQVVFVPMWYKEVDAETKEPGTINKARLIFSLYGWDRGISGNDLSYTKQKKLAEVKMEYDGQNVDTLTIMEDVEFPVSYKNIIDAYPVLQITSDRLTNSDKRKGYAYGYNIDRIILKCKDVE